MSKQAAACKRCLVTRMSALLGVESCEGWLCASIRLEASSSSARRTSSLGKIADSSIVPSQISSSIINRPALSRNSALTCSLPRWARRLRRYIPSRSGSDRTGRSKKAFDCAHNCAARAATMRSTAIAGMSRLNAAELALSTAASEPCRTISRSASVFASPVEPASRRAKESWPGSFSDNAMCRSPSLRSQDKPRNPAPMHKLSECNSVMPLLPDE